MGLAAWLLSGWKATLLGSCPRSALTMPYDPPRASWSSGTGWHSRVLNMDQSGSVPIAIIASVCGDSMGQWFWGRKVLTLTSHLFLILDSSVW